MLPQEMNVIEAIEPGSPDVLRPARRPVPQAGAGQVLIRVRAAGINGPDLMQRRGHYPPPEGASDLLGLEVSGEVVACGEGVADWSAGDMLCGLTNGGGYAEYVAVEASHCLPLPAEIDIVDVAGLPETHFTVWSNLFFGREIPKSGTALIHGGAGGIGSTAIQICAALGLRVFTTAATDDDRAFCEALGAERVIDYRNEDFVPILREAGGADLILDIIGGDYVARNIKASRLDARIINLAFNKGSKVELDLMPVMLKRLTLTGSTLRSRSDAFKTAVAAELRQYVWPLYENGRLKTVTHAVLPLAEAAEGHRMMEAATHRGKILLTP